MPLEKRLSLLIITCVNVVGKYLYETCMPEVYKTCEVPTLLVDYGVLEESYTSMRHIDDFLE